MHLRCAFVPAFWAVVVASIALVVAHSAKVPVGCVVRIARTSPCGSDDKRLYVIEVQGGGTIRLNNTQVGLEDLGQRLDEALRTRVYRYILILGEPGVMFRDVANVIDHAAPHVDHVVLVTPSVARQLNPTAGVCVDENLPEDYIKNPPRR
jgi:biopolymer transport protein ExbD